MSFLTRRSGSLSTTVVATAILALTTCLPGGILAQPSDTLSSGLQVQISIADGLLNGTADGRVVLMFAPSGVDPLDDTEVDSSPNLFFGMNVFNVASLDTVTLSGGSGAHTMTGVWGYPNVSLDDVAPGDYSVQAFLNKYEKVTRSDGSTVSVHFPCGDGAPNVDTFGSLITSVTNITVEGGPQTIQLDFDDIEPMEDFKGTEIGGCAQDNYQDTATFKYVKIRSEALSTFWGRDMYVGANILLPYGYDADDKDTRYPVIYSQGHWPGNKTSFGYPTANFSAEWDDGTIKGKDGEPDRLTPKLILVTIRHESPFYDDSYGVNTANIGPYGDAINDELIPYIEETFNTIPEPYARVQIGGSTGGWISAATVIFRPDLFGVCFSSYPDSLDFHRHQDIPLYDSANAYVRDNGSSIPSIRDFENGTEVVLASVAQENHWELTFGTSTRSSLQWDVWNAVFGVQGLNGYPLEPWNKVTGEIYPEAVEYWKHMDLANYIVSNWDNERNLGETLSGRIFIYVGTWDNYYLNEGVIEFQKRVDALGGPGWANVTILPEEPHGGNYQRRETWDFLELVDTWVQDHSPTGKTPLLSNATSSSSRGNTFAEVMSYGGHQAALARQAPPSLERGKNCTKTECVFEASVGRWDPGMVLEAQWMVNGKPISGDEQPLSVNQEDVLTYNPVAGSKWSFVQLAVTGRKMGYADETRLSNGVKMH
ncbi:hypothetical protein H2204_008321 [Knufia peltigerae]|uniref:Uncharacterized protein n=1 Tax=Knufia peltigerae TaxID=1002370 RepID=A0AA38Y1J6_9EURO|nr:hypothetical protein H2204_008321 [Knufia peltigerae]